jgi:AcrR family transcriptional regulator
MVVALSRSDWAEAALEALAEEGLAGVAIEPLARRLGTTKGSFYWHFVDRADLVAATLELWEQQGTDEVIAAIEEIPDPPQRLAALARLAYERAARGTDPHSGVLAAASDPQVGPVLERVTEKRLVFLERLYRDLGLPSDEARRHSRLSYAVYLGIGALRQAAPQSEPGGPDLDAYLDLAVQTLLEAARRSAGGQPRPRGTADRTRRDRRPE